MDLPSLSKAIKAATPKYSFLLGLVDRPNGGLKTEGNRKNRLSANALPNGGLS